MSVGYNPRDATHAGTAVAGQAVARRADAGATLPVALAWAAVGMLRAMVVIAPLGMAYGAFALLSALLDWPGAV